MKILHVLSQRPELTGSGIYLQQVITHAAKQGHKNALLAALPDDATAPELLCSLCKATFFVHFCSQQKNRHSPTCFNENRKLSARSTDALTSLPFAITGMSDVMPYPSTRFRDLTQKQRKAYEICFAEHLRKAVAEFQPDIIHTHHLWIVSSLTRQLFPSIPVVTSCHGSDLRQFRTNAHLQHLVLSGCKELDGVFALSQAQKQEIIEEYGIPSTRVHCIGAGYDATVFTQHPKPAPTPIRLLYAGKLANAKGVPWLLRAFAHLKHRVELDICGSGTGKEKETIETMAAQLGSRVRLHGNVQRDTLAALMQQAHIFVLPSFFEGVPLVLLEALACGCRLVATRLPGIAEVFSQAPEDAIRFVELPPMQNVDEPLAQGEEAFVTRITHALHAQILCCQQPFTAPQELLSRYSWSAIYQHIENIYQNTQNGT